MKKYRIKKLIPGHKIAKMFTGKQMIAVPEIENEAIEVTFDDQCMFINDWNDNVYKLNFKDRYGRTDKNGDLKRYTLGYFIWKPNEQMTLI